MLAGPAAKRVRFLGVGPDSTAGVQGGHHGNSKASTLSNGCQSLRAYFAPGSEPPPSPPTAAAPQQEQQQQQQGGVGAPAATAPNQGAEPTSEGQAATTAAAAAAEPGTGAPGTEAAAAGDQAAAPTDMAVVPASVAAAHARWVSSPDWHQQVAGMTPQAAACFTFPCGPSGAPGPWGHEQAREEVLAAGALPKYATEAWVANHYKWVVWKLACYERTFPAHCKGRALSSAGVVAQLKHR